MTKRDEINRNISFVFFIFAFFSSRCDLKSTSEKKIFFKELICYRRNYEKSTGDETYPFVEGKLFSVIDISPNDLNISVVSVWHTAEELRTTSWVTFSHRPFYTDDQVLDNQPEYIYNCAVRTQGGVMKGFSTFPKASALLEPHYRIVKCHIRTFICGVLISLQRCSRCILQPQPTGLYNLYV